MSETSRKKFTGGCACGAVRFEVVGPLRAVVGCHCETCRRTSGHYWAATQAYLDNLYMTKERGLKTFASSNFAKRGFCGECGSSLFYLRHGSDRVSIAAGCLDAPTGLRLVEEICTAEAGDYYTLRDDVELRAENEVSERSALPPDRRAFDTGTSS